MDDAERFREALVKISYADWPRLRATSYRGDGVPSKQDMCPHERRMYEDCDSCAADFARSVLEPPTT
jgi:hypothetical protein